MPPPLDNRSPDGTAVLPAQRIASAAAAGRNRGARFLRYCVLLSVLYVVLGRLGLLLAVPPGYATAIFPPAGLAATAMLIAGGASLPWTFLGALALNLWIGHAGGVSPSTALFAAALIAAASTAQAALNGWALRRAIGYPAALDSGRQILRFLLLPPLCCLTSASLSVGGLWTLGVLSWGTLATNWAAWWVGDTLGILIVLPLTLVVIGEPRSLWRARFRPVALPMLLFFGLFIAIFVRVSAWENDEQMLEFRLVSQQAFDKIRTTFTEQGSFVHQLERSFSVATPITRADFRHLVGETLEHYPMVQAIKWAPRVAPGERAAFEAAQRREVADFAIHRNVAAGSPGAAGEPGDLYPATYVAPLAGNERALGLDLASDPRQEGEVAEALASGALIATAPMRLVGVSAPEEGLHVVLAVRHGGTGPGLVAVTLRVGVLLDAISASLRRTLHLRLVDAVAGRPLYDRFASAEDAVRYRAAFEFGRRRFVVESEPSAAYLAKRRSWQSWILLSTGVLGTGLLGALLLLGTGYAHRIQAQVEERTRDLAVANNQLRIEIEERQHAETALRHAQRMEAIGRLTGGIAHDFNNLLTVVSANAELLRGAAVNERVQRYAGAILRAATRGERLTRQLLSFSRRQTLRPETVDLRQRAGELAEMLARSMRDDIDISFAVPDDLWPVAVDPIEFDLALLNVAVNARDAMPEGGQFRMIAHNLSIPPGGTSGALAGDFVALIFADSGCGMSAEVLAHAFDPYFTTKPIGAGSGLGLSQVYGFARQSGGDATIVSEPGAGTSVSLFLPRAKEGAASSVGDPRREAGLHLARIGDAPAAGRGSSGG